jgi:hypothetical protein
LEVIPSTHLSFIYSTPQINFSFVWNISQCRTFTPNYKKSFFFSFSRSFCFLIIKYWAHKDSLTPPLFIEVHVPNQEGGWSCICLLEGIEFAPFNDFSIWFWNCSDSVTFLFLILFHVIWYVICIYNLLKF